MTPAKKTTQRATAAQERRNVRFMEVIRRNPDDDAPRFLYADWLEQIGNPRGELARVQCLLNQLYVTKLNNGGRTQLTRLLKRESELMAGHSAEWEAEFGLAGIIEPGTLRFARGLPATFRIASPDVFFDHAAVLLAMSLRPEIMLPSGSLKFSAGDRYVLVQKNDNSVTESGRVTYYEGRQYLEVYQITTRPLVCKWSKFWYASDGTPPVAEGVIKQVEFRADGNGLTVTYADRTTEDIPFGTFDL